MKDNNHLLSPLIMRITSSILYGLSFGALITLFLFRLSGHSLGIKYGLIIGIGMIPGLFFYFLIFPWIAGYLDASVENKRNRLYGFLWLIPGILLLFVTYKLSFQPSFHHLEIAYTENGAEKASSQNIQLAEVKLSKTGIIPLEKISTSQQTKNKKTAAEVTSLPLPINYTFLSLQEGETVDILLSVIPPGRGVSIQFDGEKTFLFPLNDKPDQILRTFKVNNYFSSLEILLFCLGLGSILGAILFLFNSKKNRPVAGPTGERPASQEHVDIRFAKVFSVILGVCLAVGIALFISAVIPTRFDNTALRNTIDASNYAFNDLKIREKVFFALFYVLGFGLSVMVSARLVKPIMRPLAGIAAILTWLPVVNYSAFLVMQSHPLRFIWLAFCFVSLSLIATIAYATKQNMAWAAAIGYIGLWLFGISLSPYLFVKPDLSMNISMQRMALFGIVLILLFAALRRMQLKTYVRNILYACFVIIVLFLIIIPASPSYIAADMAGDAHAPFHLFAPALYSRFAQYFTPGYEYFSQYGVGAPFLFSPLLGETAAATLVNYVVLIAGLMFVFYLATYLVLKKLFDSSGWAITIVLASLFLQFWGVGMHLRAPSMLVFRYALFPFILVLLEYWVNRDFSQWGTLLLSTLVGFSIFWTTETGISFFVAVCASIIIFLGISRRSILLLVSFCIEAFIIFFGLSAIAFGWRVFSLNYIYEGILSPLIIYGGGYGALPIGWQDYLSYIINFIVPMLSIAGLGVIYHMNRSKDGTILPLNDRAMLVFLQRTVHSLFGQIFEPLGYSKLACNRAAVLYSDRILDKTSGDVFIFAHIRNSSRPPSALCSKVELRKYDHNSGSRDGSTLFILRDRIRLLVGCTRSQVLWIL